MFKIRKRSRLPHWHGTERPYFVTFNLADAIPTDVYERLKVERHIRIAELERMKRTATAAELHAIDRVIRERVEEALDEGHGKCWMGDPRIAGLLANALTHFDESRYLLFAWSVMPNHVHVVFNASDALDRILNSWKSYTSKEANKLICRKGAFWQQDYFDRTVRSRADFDRTVRYVLENPMRSELHDWPWVHSYPERFESPGETPGDCGRDARAPLRNPHAS